MPGNKPIYDQDLNMKELFASRLMDRRIDVRDRVMAEIREHSDQSSRSGLSGQNTRWLPAPRFRFSLLMAFIIIIGGLSFTAYSASQYIKLQDSKGNTVIKTEEDKSYASQEFGNLLGEYMDRAKAGLKPGQMVAFYITDKTITSADQTKVRYVYNTSFNSYEDYVKAMERTRAPRLLQPSFLPKGFSLSFSDITPRTPVHGDAEYDRLLSTFQARAKEAGNDEKLFVEPVNWTEATGSQLRYSDGRTHINIVAQSGFGLNKMTVNQPEGARSEEITIAGQKAVYLDFSADGPESYTSHSVYWFDESKGVYYGIWDSADSSLSKQDLLKIAESMIHLQ